MWNSSADKIRINFIRHGLTEGNLNKKYIGITDESLCDIGIKQLEENIKKGEYPSCDVLFCSPMKRCIQSANIIYPDKVPIIINTLSEINFGDFEEKNYKELSGNKDYIDWIESNGTLPFPNGESRSDFINRSVEGFKMIINSNKKSNNISIILHGGNIMSILSYYTGKDYYDFQISNGEGYSCIIENNNGSLFFKEINKI